MTTLFAGERLPRVPSRQLSLSRTALTDFDRLIDTLSQLCCYSGETVASTQVLKCVCQLKEYLAAGQDGKEKTCLELPLKSPTDEIPQTPSLPEISGAGSGEAYRRTAAQALRQAGLLLESIQKMKQLVRTHSRSSQPAGTGLLYQRVASAIYNIAFSWEEDLEEE